MSAFYSLQQLFKHFYSDDNSAVFQILDFQFFRFFEFFEFGFTTVIFIPKQPVTFYYYN